MPTPFLNNKTPLEKLHVKICDISTLWIFWCLFYSFTLIAHRKKEFDSHVAPSIFLDFKPYTK